MNLDGCALSIVPVRKPMQDGVVATRLSLADISHETLQRMHAYWQGKGREGKLPGRQDIDPLDFPWALGLVCLLDVQRNPLAFRYRLDGTTIAERHGADFTGRTTDEVRPDFYAAMLRKHFSEVAETRRATLHRISIRHGGQAKTYLRLALPLASDGVTVDMIMTVSDRINPDIEGDRGDLLLR
jgi:hypothetical protein